MRQIHGRRLGLEPVFKHGNDNCNSHKRTDIENVTEAEDTFV